MLYDNKEDLTSCGYDIILCGINVHVELSAGCMCSNLIGQFTVTYVYMYSQGLSKLANQIIPHKIALLTQHICSDVILSILLE